MPIFDVSAQIPEFGFSTQFNNMVNRYTFDRCRHFHWNWSIFIQMSSSVWFVIPKQIQSSTEISSFDCFERFIEIFVENHLLLYDLYPNVFINLLNCVVCKPLFETILCLKYLIVKINSEKMDINARHSLLREKLDKFGFTQPLPIASIALVSAILDDLLLANTKLKESKEYIARFEKVCRNFVVKLKRKKLNKYRKSIDLPFLQEKSAWELGVEPYKCDNSKLLAEVNSLHSDIIRQRDTYQHKIFDLNKCIRTLELENRQLSDRCAHFKNHIDELESKFEDPTQRKSRNDLLNQKRKPFVSTVRSGDFLPSTLKSIENMETAIRSGKSTKCFCQNAEKNDIFKRLYAEQEVNRAKSHLELIDLYKAQVS